MTDTLTEICNHKRSLVAAAKRTRSLADLEAAARAADTPRGFIAAIHAALDNGITLIDTAPVYGFGRSEEVVGKALKGGRRQKAVLATKCSLVWDIAAKGLYHHFGATEDGKAQPGEVATREVYRDGRAASTAWA